MKKTIKILFLCIAMLILFSTFCLASNQEPSLSNALLENENLLTTLNSATTQKANGVSIVNNDVYLGSNNDLTVSDYIYGNAFVLGQNVTISGTIEGDLFVLTTETLIIENSAKISGNVFAIANNAVFKGTCRDVYILCPEFNLTSSGYISRDLKLYSSNITIEGKIARDVLMSASSISFAENQNNLIGGNLTYSNSEELAIPDKAVAGNVEFKQITINTPTTAEIVTGYIANFISVILYATLVVLLIVFLTPKFIDKLTNCMVKRSFGTAGIGILSLVLVPILSIFLLVTGFLTYIALALLAVYILILSISISTLGIGIGNYIINKFKSKTRGKLILLSIISVAVLWGLQQLPYVGGYISLFTVVFGLGMFVHSLFIKKLKE